mmetsp:Transcript_9316/g.29059  ORF Transcript_9316/g.29059 Transcript_9316/m.29059 type:complete len:242 (-) Transcript_9316:53-778(-)
MVLANAARLALVGIRQEGAAFRLLESYAPLRPRVKALVMVPHGRTPSNEKLLFQSHREGPNATLLPESLTEAEKGADAFLDAYGDALDDCHFVRSPLHRCGQTAGVYEAVIRSRGPEPPRCASDPALVEIDHASWHGLTVDELTGADREAAVAQRAGDLLAAPADGESTLDVLERAAEWLATLEAPGVCVAFGHGTFQNACEVVLRTYGDREPADVFTREPGRSHLRRGYPHLLYDEVVDG